MKIAIELTIGDKVDIAQLEKLLTYMKGDEPSQNVENAQKVFPEAEVVQEEASLDIPFYTLSEIRNLASTKLKAGKRDEIKAILKELGVSNIAELAEDDYGKFVEKARSL